MNLRKISATALISAIAALLLSVGFGASIASADDKTPRPAPTAGSILPPRHHEGDDGENESKHDKLREQYGDDDIDQVFLPPLVVTEPGPGNTTNGSAIKPPPAGVNPGQSLTDANNIDPHANRPIDVNEIKATKQTPAEAFFEVATVALVAMGVGSAALGGIAIRRAVKLRNTPNADFIYE